jgi:hypothetical protein
MHLRSYNLDLDLTQEHLTQPEFQRWATDLRNTYGIPMPYELPADDDASN